MTKRKCDRLISTACPVAYLQKRDGTYIMVERTAEEYVNTYVQAPPMHAETKRHFAWSQKKRCLFRYDPNVIVFKAFVFFLRVWDRHHPMHSQRNDGWYLHAPVPFKCCSTTDTQKHWPATWSLHTMNFISVYHALPLASWLIAFTKPNLTNISNGKQQARYWIRKSSHLFPLGVYFSRQFEIGVWVCVSGKGREEGRETDGQTDRETKQMKLAVDLNVQHDSRWNEAFSLIHCVHSPRRRSHDLWPVRGSTACVSEPYWFF